MPTVVGLALLKAIPENFLTPITHALEILYNYFDTLQESDNLAVDYFINFFGDLS